MNDKRKISANDIISGAPPEDDVSDVISQQQDDVKTPGGLHPIVADRLARERTVKSMETHHQSDDTVPSKGEYVTRDEMRVFVADLNVQLGEISKWLNGLIESDKLYKSTIMSMQGQISGLTSRINNMFRQ